MTIKKVKKSKGVLAQYHELKASITCPITQAIFKEPVKLLLHDQGDQGAVIEKEAYEQLKLEDNPRCPISRAAICGSVRIREIEHVVAWYLNEFPHEKINQYELGTIVPIADMQTQAWFRESGKMGTRFGFITALMLYISLYQEVPSTDILALMFMFSLACGLVAEVRAGDQPLLLRSFLHMHEVNPLNTIIDSQDGMQPA